MAKHTKKAPSASTLILGVDRSNYRHESFRPVGNEAFRAAMMDKQRSGATARHTPKMFKGTRTASNRRAIKEAY